MKAMRFARTQRARKTQGKCRLKDWRWFGAQGLDATAGGLFEIISLAQIVT
jgi:hypothetical protein